MYIHIIIALFVAAVIPNRIFFKVLGWVGLVLFFIYTDNVLTNWQDKKVGYALGLAFFSIIIQTVIYTVTCKLLIFVCIQYKTNLYKQEINYYSYYLQSLCWGFILPIFLLLLFGHILKVFIYAWVIHISLMLVAIVVFILSYRTKKIENNSNTKYYYKYIHGFLNSLSISLIFFLFSSVIYSYKVASTIYDIAKNKPYCIQIADSQSDYQIIRSYLDLSLIVMRAQRKRDSYIQFHGLLVIQEEDTYNIMNWSYRQGLFLKDAQKAKENGFSVPIRCTPKTNFFDNISIL